MKKKGIGLIAGCVLVAGLAGAVAVVSQQKQVEEEAEESASAASSAESSDGEIVLSDQETNSVVSVQVTNSTGSYEVVRTQEADEEAETDAVYAIKGWEDLPTKNSVVRTLANNIASLTDASLVQEDVTDLDKYGLGDDATRAVMTFDDGSTFAFRIGNAVSDGENTYFAVEGSNTVYTVRQSLVANYQNAAEDFLSTTILEEPDDDDMPTVNTTTVSRTDLDYDIVLTYDPDANDSNTGGTASSYEMTEPIAAYLSVDRSTPVISGMFGMTVDHVLKIAPEEADFAEYGLDTPFGTAVMDCDDGNVYTLTIGTRYTEKDEETGDTVAYYPVYLDGVDAIYSMTEENCVWATVTPTDVASKLVITTYVWDVAELTVSAPNKETMDFVNSGTDKDTASITCNGEACDTERYRLFYTFLLATAAESVALDEEPVGEPAATLYFRTHDGSTEKEICFYRQDDFNCLMTVNGVSSFLCRASYIDAFLENMDRFDTDEDFLTTWS
jgi:hypothetical protein